MHTQPCGLVHTQYPYNNLQEVYDNAASTMANASLLWNERTLTKRTEAVRLALFTRISLLKISLLTLPKNFRSIREYILSSFTHEKNKTVHFYLSIIKTSFLFIGKVVTRQLLAIVSGLFPEIFLNKIHANNFLFRMQIEEFLLTLPPLHILNARQKVFDPLPTEDFLLAIAERSSLAKNHLRLELLKNEDYEERSALFDTNSKIFQESLKTAIEQILKDPQIDLIHQELETHTFFDKFVSPLLYLLQTYDSFILRFLSRIQEEIFLIQNTSQTIKTQALLTTIYEQAQNILPERKEDDLVFFSIEQNRTEHVLKAIDNLAASIIQYFRHPASGTNREDLQEAFVGISVLKICMQKSFKILVNAPQTLLNFYNLNPDKRVATMERLTLLVTHMVENTIESLYADEELSILPEDRTKYDVRTEKTKAMCDMLLQVMIRAKNTLLDKGLIEKEDIEIVDVKAYDAILHTALHYLIKDAVSTSTNLILQNNKKTVVLANNDEALGALPYLQKLKMLHTSLFKKNNQQEEDEQKILHLLSGKPASDERFVQYKEAFSNREFRELLNRMTSVDNIAPQDRTDWSLAFSV